MRCSRRLLRPRRTGARTGLERAGDNLGAVGGPLLAAALVASIGIRPTLYLAAVPGALAAIAISVAAAEARRQHRPAPRRARIDFRGLREAGLFGPLLPVSAFELGNMATTLLILRATDLLHGNGRSLAAATSLAVLIYAGHNVAASVVAYGGGHWIDRAGPRRAFASAAGLYALSYALLAFPLGNPLLLVFAFVLAGSGIGLAETAESALVARLLPDRLRGSGFGLFGGIQSLGDFTSSAVVGLLWTLISPAAGFTYAAGWMLVAGVSGVRARAMGG
jgi:MFS family permease